MNTFAVLGTPRSRTAWFAKFLSYGDYVCEHEPSRHWSGPNDIREFFRPGLGASDSMLTLRWRDVIAIPDIRIVIVVRPLQEVIDSAKGVGLDGRVVLLRIAAAIVDLAADRPDIPIIPYGELTPQRCAAIFSYLLGVPCPDDWLQKWVSTEVLADIGKMWQDARANADGLRSLYGG